MLPPSTQPSKCSDKEGQAQIERITQDMHKAMETLDFSDDSPLWSNLAQSFVYESPHPGMPGITRGKQDFLHFMERLHREYPGYKYHVLDLTTEIQPEENTGSVFLNVETEGPPLGVIRRFLTVLQFKKRTDGWFMIRASSLQGLSDQGFSGGQQPF